MTEQLPSKTDLALHDAQCQCGECSVPEQPSSNEVAMPSMVKLHYGWLHIPDTHVGTDMPAWASAIDVQRLEQDLARYENGRVVMSGEIERLRMAERLNVETVARLQQERDDLKARIDALMLEYCPDEITGEQVEEWGKHQRLAQPPSDAQWQSCVDNPPKEWTVVLAYRPGPNMAYFLAERFLHSSGKYLWTMNGVTGHGVEPPSHWMPLPGAPVTKPACVHDLQRKDKTVQMHQANGLVGWKCTVCSDVWMPEVSTKSKPERPCYCSDFQGVNLYCPTHGTKGSDSYDANGSPVEPPDCPHCDGFEVDGTVLHGPRCPEAEKTERWTEPAKHCQNGGDVCLAGNKDGICCPDDSCDIDDGMESRDPRRASAETQATRDDPLAAVRWICPDCTTVNGIKDNTCLGCRKVSRAPTSEGESR